MDKMIVAVVIYPGVEVVDMNGPIDVLVKANRQNGDKYVVFTVAETEEEIKSERSSVCITPEHTFTSCPDPDIIILPGQVLPEGSPQTFGSGSDALINWIKKQAEDNNKIIMSVCVGIYILAKTGLLSGRQATTHWKALEEVQDQYPDITMIKNVRFIQDGNFITTGGITSGIDGALHLVEILENPGKAKDVANIMVYNREAPLPPDTILA